MPWLTPNSIPEEDGCRPLFIPADSTWFALVSGALTELTKPYNWQEFGSLTVQQTVDRMQEIIDSYYDTACATCTTPGGYRVTRISSTGHVQQLNASGEWEDATDDYVIPAPTARTEGTTPDQNCLAAKNATNVLSQLYESLSESYASEFSTDEAVTAFIAAAVAIVGFEFAPITWSIAAFGFVFFEALFRALEYITADLWTEDFSREFECLLLGCVNNDAGVVTFDWDCFNAALLAQTNDMGLSEVQMRLYVQIGFMLHFIGGVDGLNLAARTTDITNDDCSFCGCEDCMILNTTLTENCYTINRGTFELGAGVKSVYSDDPDKKNDLALVSRAIDVPASVTSVGFTWQVSTVGGSPIILIRGFVGMTMTTLVNEALSVGTGSRDVSVADVYDHYEWILVPSQGDTGSADGWITEIRVTCE